MLPEINHRFSVADFYRMAEAGILREDRRVEPLDGEIKDMMPIGEFHATVVDILSHDPQNRPVRCPLLIP